MTNASHQRTMQRDTLNILQTMNTIAFNTVCINNIQCCIINIFTCSNEWAAGWFHVLHDAQSMTKSLACAMCVQTEF